MSNHTTPPRPDEWTVEKSLCLCVECGEEIGFVKKLRCVNCMSVAGRKALADENEKAVARLNHLRETNQWIYA